MSQAIQSMLQYHHQTRHYPGAAVLIERDGNVVVRCASGHLHGYPAGGGGSQSMHEGVRFRIASLTKGMVSMVALRLIDSGRLALDAPVAELLPELADQRLLGGEKPERVPSLRDCLRHTAGFGNLGETSHPQIREACAEVPIEGEVARLTRDEFLSRLSRRPLTAPPGALFQYGLSTDVVGLMIERATDQSLLAALHEWLFDPLQMSSTGFRVAPSEHAAMPRAFDEDNAWHAFVANYEAADQMAVDAPTDPMRPTGQMQSGGGGLVSTLDDVGRYARMIAAGGIVDGQRLISETLFAEAMTNQLGPMVPGPFNYTGGGFGFGLAGAIRNDWAPAAIPSPRGEFAWSGVTGHSLFIQPGRGWFALMLSSNTASRVIVRLEFRRASESAR